MRPRTQIVGTIVAAGGASAALLGYLLFAGRRSLVTTGDANLQRWAGPAASRWLYLAIVVFLVAVFAAAAVLGTQPATRDRGWRLGGGAGAVTGLAIGVLTLLTGALATDPAPLTGAVLASFLAALAGAPVVGGWVARFTRRTGDGALAGLWFGLLLAVVAGFFLVLRDTAFAERLVAGAWLHDSFGDSLCNNT